MLITPTGAPAWVRTNDFTTYGGHAEKENYLGRGAIDALTDVDATQFARLTSDMAAVARTAPFAVLGFGCRDTPDSGAPIMGGYWDPIIEEPVLGGGIQMMTGVRLIHYFGDKPLPGYPSAERVSDGCVDISFEGTYTDAFGVVGPFTIGSPSPGNAIADTLAYVAVEILNPHTIRVRVFDEDKVTPLANGRVAGLTVY